MENKILNPWIYRVNYISNYDGDTIKFMRDCGCNVYHKVTVRLLDIDTPEIRGGTTASKKHAHEAKEFVKEVLSEAKRIYIETIKDKKGKYGRYLAKVWYVSLLTSELTCLNEELLRKGFIKNDK